jgi:putative phosphoesterase
VALIVHLGDFTGADIPELFEALGPLEAVAGNNDPPELVARFGRRKVLPVGGIRLGLVHGDGPRGTTIDRSVGAFAKNEAVDVICFGHSHQPLCERRGATWLVNPGRLTFPSAQPARSSLSKSSASSRTSSARRSTP